MTLIGALTLYAEVMKSSGRQLFYSVLHTGGLLPLRLIRKLICQCRGLSLKAGFPEEPLICALSPHLQCPGKVPAGRPDRPADQSTEAAGTVLSLDTVCLQPESNPRTPSLLLIRSRSSIANKPYQTGKEVTEEKIVEHDQMSFKQQGLLPPFCPEGNLIPRLNHRNPSDSSCRSEHSQKNRPQICKKAPNQKSWDTTNND